MKKLLTLICILAFANLYCTNYYVAKTGNNNNTGRSVTSPWRTIQRAASYDLSPGDTIFVKAGNYGNEQVVFYTSGTALKKIVFKGYRNNPRETVFPLLDMDGNYTALTSFDTLKMPTLRGISRASGIGMNLNQVSHVKIENFQVENYASAYSCGAIIGSNSTSNGITFYNCNSNKTGDINNIYSGSGIRLGFFQEKRWGKKNEALHCLILNSSAEGISITGDSCSIIGCLVYSNDVSTQYASTNYFISICGSYNSVLNNKVIREKGMPHMGYGVVVRTSVNPSETPSIPNLSPLIKSQYNLIKYCLSRNMGEAFVVKHRGSILNGFYECSSYGTNDNNTNITQEESTCVMIKDGANNNTFDAMFATNCKTGIGFSETTEDGQGYLSYTNYITNGIFTLCYYSVRFFQGDVAWEAGSNLISNNTFDKSVNMFQCDRPCARISYFNNIFNNNSRNFSSGYYSYDIKGSNFYHCDFYLTNLDATFISSGFNCISANPVFLSENDWNLQTASPCKTSGMYLKYVPKDHVGRIRTTPTSMGAMK